MKTRMNKTFRAMFLVTVTFSLVRIAAAIEPAFTYNFSANSQGWRYMGLYDGGGLTPLAEFIMVKNPWTDIDGNGGAILLGQEGFATQSPSGAAWVHGDLNSPDLAYVPKSRTFGLKFDITGTHMASADTVFVQAVVVVRRPNEISDRLYRSEFLEVPLGDDGAWDTHTFSVPLTSGTVIKKINLRIYFETSSLYWGWILVDNVLLF